MSFTMLLGGCDQTHGRPDQDLFTIHASEKQMERLLTKLSDRFDASPDVYNLDTPNSAPRRMFRIDGANATLIIIPEADDRCNFNGWHSTFKQGEYRIDLIYRSHDLTVRRSNRVALIRAAKRSGLPMSAFKDC